MNGMIGNESRRPLGSSRETEAYVIKLGSTSAKANQVSGFTII